MSSRLLHTIKHIVNTFVQFGPVCVQTTNPSGGIAAKNPVMIVGILAVTPSSSSVADARVRHPQIPHQVASKCSATSLLNMQIDKNVSAQIQSVVSSQNAVVKDETVLSTDILERLQCLIFTGMVLNYRSMITEVKD